MKISVVRTRTVRDIKVAAKGKEKLSMRLH